MSPEMVLAGRLLVAFLVAWFLAAILSLFIARKSDDS